MNDRDAKYVEQLKAYIENQHENGYDPLILYDMDSCPGLENNGEIMEVEE